MRLTTISPQNKKMVKKLQNETSDSGRHLINKEKQKVGDKTLLNIQAALSLIPYAGGFLATYFGEIRNKRVEERMHKYFQYFSDRLNQIDEKKIDHEYLKSEQFTEFFMQGAEQAAKSTTDQRIRRFANILINNALKDAKARERTQSIMSFVDRVSDLDAFILLCYGHPKLPSLRAQSKDKAVSLVRDLVEYLGVDSPSYEDVIESIVYMDNLGITWVNEKFIDESEEKGGNLILKEFSSFRTPLGDAVTAMIAPPGFYLEQVPEKIDPIWPDDYIGKAFRNIRRI